MNILRNVVANGHSLTLDNVFGIPVTLSFPRERDPFHMEYRLGPLTKSQGLKIRMGLYGQSVLDMWDTGMISFHRPVELETERFCEWTFFHDERPEGATYRSLSFYKKDAGEVYDFLKRGLDGKAHVLRLSEFRALADGTEERYARSWFSSWESRGKFVFLDDVTGDIHYSLNHVLMVATVSMIEQSSTSHKWLGKMNRAQAEYVRRVITE